MHWTLITSLVGATVAAYLTSRDRKNAIDPRWWAIPSVVALLPPSLVAAIGFVLGMDADDGLRLLQFGFFGVAFVTTLSMVLITFGRAGDGRVVRWLSPVLALIGVVVAGIASPMLAAWVAPVVVMAVCAQELPRAASVRVRARTVAALGVSSVLFIDAGFLIQRSLDELGPTAVTDGVLLTMDGSGPTSWFADFGPLLSLSVLFLAIGLAVSLFTSR